MEIFCAFTVQTGGFTSQIRAYSRLYGRSSGLELVSILLLERGVLYSLYLKWIYLRIFIDWYQDDAD